MCPSLFVVKEVMRLHKDTYVQKCLHSAPGSALWEFGSHPARQQDQYSLLLQTSDTVRTTEAEER